jgi:hypothetical protein
MHGIKKLKVKKLLNQNCKTTNQYKILNQTFPREMKGVFGSRG